MTEYFFNNARSLRILKNKHNVDVRQFSDEIVKKFFTTSKDIVKENSFNNTDYINIYEDWKRTIELFNEYHKYSDNEYMKLRLRNS